MRCRRPAHLKFAEPKFPSHQHSTSAHPQRCFFRQTLRFAFLPVGGGGTRMARRIV